MRRECVIPAIFRRESTPPLMDARWKIAGMTSLRSVARAFFNGSQIPMPSVDDFAVALPSTPKTTAQDRLRATRATWSRV